MASAFCTNDADDNGSDDDTATGDDSTAASVNGDASADESAEAMPVAAAINMPEEFPDDIPLPEGEVSSYMAFADRDGKTHNLTIRMEDEDDPAKVIADIREDYAGGGFKIVTDSQDLQDSGVVAGFVWTNSKYDYNNSFSAQPAFEDEGFDGVLLTVAVVDPAGADPDAGGEVETTHDPNMDGEVVPSEEIIDPEDVTDEDLEDKTLAELEREGQREAIERGELDPEDSAVADEYE